MAFPRGLCTEQKEGQAPHRTAVSLSLSPSLSLSFSQCTSLHHRTSFSHHLIINRAFALFLFFFVCFFFKTHLLSPYFSPHLSGFPEVRACESLISHRVAEPEKYRIIICQLVILASVLKLMKVLYCLQIHATHTSTQTEILCGYR